MRVVAADGLYPIRGDPGQFEQTILNLAANARDAMPNGGRLLLETANRILDDEYCRTHAGVAPGRYVMIAVSDTGSGMSKEVLDHLFEPFFPTKEKGKGTGLGLATVYGIVKQNGGVIEVYSEVNHGTTFRIHFPRTLQDISPAGHPGAAEAPPTGNETILLIEDDANVLEFTCSTLTRLGYHVIVASSSEEAMDISARCADTIDLLMTDVILPGMNGRATADAIDRHGILEQGLSFLAKPFAVRSLAERVREVLDRKPVG